MSPNDAARRRATAWFAAAAISVAAGCTSSHARSLPRAAEVSQTGEEHSVLVHDFTQGLYGVRALNSAVKLRVDRDSNVGDEPVLVIDYPAPDADPASRDVAFDVENRNWTSGHALQLRLKPSHPIRISVSWLDRNRVAYTWWSELRDTGWQTLRVPFGEIKPNPYFQPPGAKLGSSLDVSDVRYMALSPQDSSSGELAIARISVVKQ